MSNLLLGHSPYSHPGTIYPFNHLFDKAERLDYTPPKNCDAILLWGGTDINPKYYNELPHPNNGYIADSPRDQAEWAWMSEAIEHGVPIIGVCRGAQFLCAKAGGKLIQHMHGHHGPHMVTTSEGDKFVISSDHHQAMLPVGTNFDLLAWSADGIPEVVYFPNIKGLAIQSHPEWEDFNSAAVGYSLGLIEQLLKGTL